MPNFGLLQDFLNNSAWLSDTVQHLSVMLEGENHAHPQEDQTSYLGTLGGARVGREGTWGGPPRASLPLGNRGRGPGRNGTGGAPDWGPGDGIAGAGPRPGKGLVGGLFKVGLLWVEGLGGGDLVKYQRFKFSKVEFGVLFVSFFIIFKQILKPF